MRPEEIRTRRQKAIEMRQAGLSKSQIAQALGLKSSGGALSHWLKEVPTPDWTKRPRAKDDLRERALAMRKEGRSYREIQKALGLSKGSLSLWLQDVPLSDEHRIALEERGIRARKRTAETLKARRIARERTVVRDAAAQIPELAESELFVAGVVAYWAEGSKSKPWRSGGRVIFTNSDPGMILLFLRWLSLIGVEKDRVRFRISIHESADVEAATKFWSDLVQISEHRFLKASLKRHNPKTNRKNADHGYCGCLVVMVSCNTDLYRRINGWFDGIVERLVANPPLTAQ